jgi:hypothetical protein
MRPRIRLSLVIACLILAGCVRLSVAQESRQKADTPKLTLGDSDGSPGGSIVVPIYFSPSESVEVGELKAMVTFVSKNMKYSSIKKGLAAESGNVDLKAELKEGKNDKGLETSTLTITAVIPSPKPGQKGIPPGLIGYLTLKVNETAGPANITMRTTGQAMELGTKKALPKLDTIDAQVDILANGSEPLVSCFFFSH